MEKNKEKLYTTEEKEIVLAKYEEFNQPTSKKQPRPSYITASLYREEYKMSPNIVKEILNDYKIESYLNIKIKSVSKENIIHLFDNMEKDIIDINKIYPDLTFAEIKEVIEGYYTMLSIKKPRGISFPRRNIQLRLKEKTIDEVCEEFGYEEDYIFKKFEECIERKKVTKEELVDLKMLVLNRGLALYKNGKISIQDFKQRYFNQNPQKVEAEVKVYMKDRKSKKF